MRPVTGDWVMSGPTPGHEGIYQKAIKLTGARHTHDELIVELDGELFTGSAETPHFRLVPLAEKLKAVERGEMIFGVFRWGSTAEPGEVWQKQVSTAIRLMAALELPYDKGAILSMGRNWLRKKLGVSGWLGNVWRQDDFEVFCTESCVTVYETVGLEIRKAMGFVPLVGPLQAEGLFARDYLVPVADYGLMGELS
jgi:hypothetical protein